jgi:hypothetical protein
MFSRQTHRGPLILLAVNSPIFAPIVLAKALNLEGLGTIELSVAGTERDYNKASNVRIDPLVRQVLLKRPAMARPIVGVGDPMRLASLAANEAGYLEPVILGSLITKMCYWILHDIRKHDHLGCKVWEKHYGGLITHPKGMTGYTVPLYDLRTRGVGVNDATSLLHGDFTDPDDEFAFYSQVRRLWSEDGPAGSNPPAFITTNPLHASRAGVNGSRFTMIKEYPTEPGFDKVVMSALFAAGPAVEGHAKALVRSLLNAIPQAIQIIRASSDFATYHIVEAFNREPKLVGGASACFGLTGPQALGDCLGHLAETEVFNVDSQLRADPEAITSTLAIREKIEDALDKPYKVRGAAQLRSLFSPIQDTSA